MKKLSNCRIVELANEEIVELSNVHSNIRSFSNSTIRQFDNSVISHRGFTLVELLVVVGMIMIISAAMMTSTHKARTRAKVAAATQETREMTNAILAYEQYAKDRSLESQVTGGSWRDCTEGAMGLILGKGSGESGETIPVLFKAPILDGAIRDPWGRVYQYMIDKTGELSDSVQSPETAATLPNYYRLTDRERGVE